MSKHNARQMAREKLLFRYSNALERGDFETVAAILREAEKDSWLSSMIAEMDAVYAQETHPFHSPQTFSLNNHHEDRPMNTTYAVVRRPATVHWPSVTLLAAIAATIIIGVLLVTLRRFNPQQENIGAVSSQQQATPTPIASLTATPVPVPATTYPIYQEPNLGATAILGVSGGTPVTLMAQSSDGQWFQVMLITGETGWMRRQDLILDFGSPQVRTDVLSPTVIPSSALPPAVSAATFFEYGGHINDLTNVATDRALRLSGMTWVKFQVEFNPDQSSGADVLPLIGVTHDRGFRVLLTVVPRSEDIQRSGETTYQQQFINFLVEVANWYPDAIEVWQEPNIDRWWPTNQISGQSYVNLLEQTYRAIKSANPNVMVISAAPAPTSAGSQFPGQVMNDDRWLQEVVSAGGLQYMDCLGAHYVEGVVSPLATSGDPRDNLYTRYFNTMFETYLNISGGQKSICWTEVGYLAPEGFAPPSDSFAWAKDTFAWEQGIWLAQAAALSARSGRVRLMIVWNVDFNTVNTETPGYAIIRPDGSCPACEALAAVNIVIGLQVQRVLDDAVDPPSVVATALPIEPTPTAFFDSALRQGNVSLMTTSPIGDLPAGARVKIKSAFFDGTSWTYAVETEDGRLYQAFEWQLVQTVNPPPTPIPTHTATSTPTLIPTWTHTPMPTPPILCRVTNLSDAELRVRSQANADATVIGFMPPNTTADVIRQEHSSAEGRIWYLIAAQIEDSRIEGWVLSDTVTQVENCPAFQ